MRLLVVMVAGLILASSAFAADLSEANREFSSDVAEALNDRLRLAMGIRQINGMGLEPSHCGQNIWFGDLQTTFGISADTPTYLAREDDFIERLHPDDRERVSKTLADATQNRSEYRAEYRVVRIDKTGTTRWLAEAAGSSIPHPMA